MSWIASDDGPWILVTNDDSLDSPSLAPLLGQLSTILPVRAVLPAAECSWTGKRMTRFGEVELAGIESAAIPTWTLSGSPADCANVGIHHLCERQPCLVVSGINVGTNAGLAYILSSGTIGAAVEAALNGVPALAFSVGLEKADYERWRQTRDLSNLVDLWAAAARVSAEIAAEAVSGGLPEGCALLNVNMPPTTTASTARRMTSISKSSYGSFFKRVGPGRYSYDSANLEIQQAGGDSDLNVLAAGAVSITPMQLDQSIAVGPDGARFRSSRVVDWELPDAAKPG